jgi:hypothetical protein
VGQPNNIEDAVLLYTIDGFTQGNVGGDMRHDQLLGSQHEGVLRAPTQPAMNSVCPVKSGALSRVASLLMGRVTSAETFRRGPVASHTRHTSAPHALTFLRDCRFADQSQPAVRVDDVDLSLNRLADPGDPVQRCLIFQHPVAQLEDTEIAHHHKILRQIAIDEGMEDDLGPTPLLSPIVIAIVIACFLI